MRDEITRLFEEAGQDYKKRNIADFKIHQGHDVHAFYRLPENTRNFVHVQGYPGMSTEQSARVFARLMDYDKAMAIRNTGVASIGNEHMATIEVFPNFEGGVLIPYRTEVLQGMLASNVPELAPAFALTNVNFDKNLALKPIIPEDKRSLRDYLKAIDFRDTKQLMNKSAEIISHMRKTMSPYKNGERGEPLQCYYAPAVDMIEEAYRLRDFHTLFPEALDFMIASVDWE